MLQDAQLGAGTADVGQLLTVGEVARQLNVCSATVYKLCASGHLRHVRVVNAIRVATADLEAYIAGGRR